MKPPTNNKALPTVLFIDDEELAQKYFRKAIEPSYEVLTASSVDKANDLLSEHADRIGVVVTDQRMPNATGTSLLKRINEQNPEIVRILTTAYSDLESAIEAVNEGHIYRYMNKPWEIRELQVVVRQAVELFCLQREYDALVAEKLSVIQKMVLTDRAKTLCVVCASLKNTINHPQDAVRDYIRLMAEAVSEPNTQEAAGWEDLWTSAVDETIAAVRVVDLLLESLQAGQSEPAQTGVAELIRAGSERLTGVDCTVSPDTPAIHAEPDFLQRWVDALYRLAESITEVAESVKLACGPDDGGASVSVQLSGTATPDMASKLLKLVNGARWDAKGPHLDLLILFFAAHHLGGQIHTHWGAMSEFKFQFTLPCVAENAKRDQPPDVWVESLFDPLEE